MAVARQSINNLHKGNPAWGSKALGTGKSGNPNGPKPKDCSLTSLLKAQLDDPVPGDKEKRTWRQILVERWMAQSLKQPVYFKELLERVEGRVPHRQEITGADGGPVQVSNEALVAKLEAIAQSVQHAKPGGTED